MTRRSTLEFLQDILDAIRAIDRFVYGLSLDELEQDEKTLFAVARAFEIIGEAVKNLPESFRGQYARIPWKDIAGMRDKLIHHYWGIDTAVLWKTLQQDLPQLTIMITRIMQDLDSDETLP